LPFPSAWWATYYFTEDQFLRDKSHKEGRHWQGLCGMTLTMLWWPDEFAFHSESGEDVSTHTQFLNLRQQKVKGHGEKHWQLQHHTTVGTSNQWHVQCSHLQEQN
jgi:hypothetical protein